MPRPPKWNFEGAARLLSTLDLDDILIPESDVSIALLAALDQWLIDNGATLGDSREIELRVSGDELQWRYIDTPALAWETLYDLSTLIGPPGADGADGNDIISGTAVPTGATGLDGNFYIRLPMLDFYGPKASGSWPAPISLIGPQGDAGPPGAPGDDGAPGADGADGTDGLDGAPGSDGFSVLSGTAAPTTEGVNGDFYIRTSNWTIYGPKSGGAWGSPTSLVGPQGAQGDPGPQGDPGTNGRYLHTQASASATWTITHNLGYRVSFGVFLDSDPNTLCFTDQSHPDVNTTVLEFPSAVTGKAVA